MTGTTRRRVLQSGAAVAGAYALGCPAIVRAQADKIKIGHLTPLTGFLGALGEYAVLGLRMAEEEINKSGGVMGRQIEVMSEDSINPATAATKAQRMLERDGATVLMGEISSASAQTPWRPRAATSGSICTLALAPTSCAARTATSTRSTSTSPTP